MQREIHLSSLKDQDHKGVRSENSGNYKSSSHFVYLEGLAFINTKPYTAVLNGFSGAESLEDYLRGNQCLEPKGCQAHRAGPSLAR